MPRVIISGGGTGGHIFPAIAIADAIKAKAPDSVILFVGANGRMEMEKVPAAGYDIVGLDVVGFQRKFTWKNLVFPFKLASSLIKALSIVKKFNPDVAIGVGGYASGPVLKIASSMGIKTVLQEQNSYAGVTNRLLASKASLICVAYDGMDKFFPVNKIRFTGNPIRQSLRSLKLDSVQAKQALGLDPNKKMVLVFGGSLGARSINNAIIHYAEHIAQWKDLSLFWQVGKAYYSDYQDHPIQSLSHVKVVPFIENMDVAYSAADIVVARAGALTISELAVLHKACILCPSPNVAEDHQTVNAQALVQKEAAIMVRDDEAKEKLYPTMMSLLGDNTKIKRLSENIAYFSRENAADTIATYILDLISKKEGA
jgi:UDP-N-acetylglucosamine--N-acetylmuramyl-(pentapeptide) pyrophosphoryl-undecaprenol N-acetylglucosamine transferase